MMTRHDFITRPKARVCLITALVLAALGQIFLAQKEFHFTLYAGFAFFAAAVFLFYRVFRENPTGPTELPPVLERTIFLGIFLLAVILRVYRLEDFPPGLSADEASIGLGGLSILREGWRPLFETFLFNQPALIFYFAAAWFKFFQPSVTHLHLFFVVLSLLSFPLIYWTFRQLAGPVPALLTLYFLAVSRWWIYYSRWGHETLLPAFFVFGALSFWLYGTLQRRIRAHVISGLFLGAGLYTYFSFRIFLFIMVGFAIFEAVRAPGLFKRERFRWMALFLAFFAVACPLLWHWARQPFWGQGYPAGISIFGEIFEKKSLVPLFRNGFQTAMMFNRSGDPGSLHNIMSHRMLDDITGALWILGLGFALFRLLERKYFYPVLAILLFSLNGSLSADPTNANRTLLMLPFMAYLASVPVWMVYQKLKSRRSSLGMIPFLLAALLAVAGVQNFHQLFAVQSRQPLLWQVFDVGQTRVGKDIVRQGKDYDYYLCPRYGAHYVIRFLAFFQQTDYRSWDWPKDLALPAVSPGKKGVCFVMAEGESGVFHLLETLYPRAQTEVLRDREGFPISYSVRVSREELLAVRGMKTEEPSGETSLFPHFPQGLETASFPATFSGFLFLEKSGPHRFIFHPVRSCHCRLDGQEITSGEPVTLVRGFHELKIRFTGTKAPEIRFWGQTPDASRFPVDFNRLTLLPLNRGLKAEYRLARSPAEPVFFSQWDPLVNFIHKTDFPLFQESLNARWTGRLWIPAGGPYEFMILTEAKNRAQLSLDGKPLIPLDCRAPVQADVRQGWHDLTLDFHTGKEFFSAVSLAWKKPGQDRFEVIPTQSFGEVR